MNYLQKEYPEVNLEKKNRLRGVVEGQIASIKINDRNLKKFSDFENIFKDYGYEIVIENKDTKEKRTITVGRFMEETYPLRPDIYSRFKGLGETDAEDMGKTTLDPENRILVQLTMDDAKEALKIFNEIIDIYQKHNVSYQCACRLSIALNEAFMTGAVELYNQEHGL